MHFGEEGAATVLQAVLRQVTERRPLGRLDIAAVSLHLAGEHAQQGGLAGAVFAAQTDPVPRTQMPVDVGKNAPSAKILDDVFELQHGRGYSTERRLVSVRFPGPRWPRFYGICRNRAGGTVAAFSP